MSRMKIQVNEDANFVVVAFVAVQIRPAILVNS